MVNRNSYPVDENGAEAAAGIPSAVEVPAESGAERELIEPGPLDLFDLLKEAESIEEVSSYRGIPSDYNPNITSLEALEHDAKSTNNSEILEIFSKINELISGLRTMNDHDSSRAIQSIGLLKVQALDTYTEQQIRFNQANKSRPIEPSEETKEQISSLLALDVKGKNTQDMINRGHRRSEILIKGLSQGWYGEPGRKLLPEIEKELVDLVEEANRINMEINTLKLEVLQSLYESLYRSVENIKSKNGSSISPEEGLHLRLKPEQKLNKMRQQKVDLEEFLAAFPEFLAE